MWNYKSQGPQLTKIWLGWPQINALKWELSSQNFTLNPPSRFTPLIRPWHPYESAYITSFTADLHVRIRYIRQRTNYKFLLLAIFRSFHSLIFLYSRATG